MKTRLLLAAMVLCGCHERTQSLPPTSTPSPALSAAAPQAAPPLRVGNKIFAESDLATRERIVHWKYPEAENPRLYAVSQLIQGALLETTLERLGHPITAQDLAAELARIDASTRDPEGLATLKSLCGGAQGDTFGRIATLPDFANRRFYFEVYPKLDAVHAERLRQAQTVQRSLAGQGANADLAAVAKADSAWQHSELLFTAARGFYRADEPMSQPVATAAPGKIQAALANNDTQWAEYERDLFAKTAARVIVNHVVTLPEGFMLLRWTGWENQAAGVRRVEQLYLPKRPADEVFWEIAGTIDVALGDEKLREQLVKNVSWMPRVRFVRGESATR